MYTYHVYTFEVYDYILYECGRWSTQYYITFTLNAVKAPIHKAHGRLIIYPVPCTMPVSKNINK